MIPPGFMPPDFRGDVQEFEGPVTWKPWYKPRGAVMVAITAIGSGAGGGGGHSAANGNTRGGGGGGGSAAVTRLVIPATLLPDVLYVDVPAGGAGVTSGTGGAGSLSRVAIWPDTTSILNLVVTSGSTGASGGGTGTGAGVGVAGAAGGGGALGTNFALAGLGMVSSISGQAGTAGGAVAGGNGTAIAIPTTGIVTMGGTGGAGTQNASFAGGAVTGVANMWISDRRPATPAAGSNPGSSGVQLYAPWFAFGGLGGSSANNAAGGAGGYGALGAGGGGGGAGTTGGKGGNGGQGYVQIVSW